ncbi:hypothetical protein NPIL_6071 [Nephila pilipes]|uniref:Uncharacterized protein n=1 Tax=Nephila pilipes TaxID=299642 RepID=A0A8X6TTL6_NEPPI|nr:hypothetical protein NPIL_6071 [Nephila pilipes]
MAFLDKVRKEDLLFLADEMSLFLDLDLKILQIMKSSQYKEDVVKYLLCNFVDDRKEREEEKRNAKEQAKLDKKHVYKLEKLRLNLEA